VQEKAKTDYDLPWVAGVYARVRPGVNNLTKMDAIYAVTEKPGVFVKLFHGDDVDLPVQNRTATPTPSQIGGLPFDCRRQDWRRFGRESTIRRAEGMDGA
jgi:hypothetical protein